jgi:hypothetical protein
LTPGTLFFKLEKDLKFIHRRFLGDGGPMQRLYALIMLIFLGMAGCVTEPEKLNWDNIDATKPYIEIILIYNFDVYEKPLFFMPKSHPTYAIWVEESTSDRIRLIYITGKASQDSWWFADSRPEAIPVWDGVEKRTKNQRALDIDAISGATPGGEMATILWPVPNDLLNRTVDVYIEANSSYDYNEYYCTEQGSPGYSAENGQPSLIWKATLDLSDPAGMEVSPDIIGHGQVLGKDYNIDPDISKITTAAETFQDIRVRYISGRHS